MNALANREGRYLYADGFAKDLTFDEGRTFRVLVASAYDAGIIGPEYNGIVVLDLDNASVALDQHVRISSGYYGPSAEQKAEFERICAISDWREFASFVKSHPRYRAGSVPDVDQAKPDAPDEAARVLKVLSGATKDSLGGKDILPADLVALHDDASSPYAFPDRTRLDIVAAIAGHEVHSERFEGARLAWNIKVYGFDSSGKSEGFSPDPAYDKLWEACVEKDEHLFQQAADDGLSYYVDGDALSATGEHSRGKFEFATEGRSGGWLVLTKFDGARMSWPSRNDMVEALLEMDEKDLVELYAGVKTFDATIDAKKEMAFQFSLIRQLKEEEWKADPSDAVDLAERLELEDWAPPSAPTPAP